MEKLKEMLGKLTKRTKYVYGDNMTTTQQHSDSIRYVDILTSPTAPKDIEQGYDNLSFLRSLIKNENDQLHDFLMKYKGANL